MNTSWQEHLAHHTTTALEAVQAAVRSGDFVVLGHAVATPSSLTQALFDDHQRLTDVKVFHMLYFAEPWHLRPEMKGHVQPILNFLDKNSRPALIVASVALNAIALATSALSTVDLSVTTTSCVEGRLRRMVK